MNKIDGKTYRIALDAMGGDFAPINEVHGAISAFQNKKRDFELEIVFLGKENKIRAALAQFDFSGYKFSIVNADEIVSMDDESTSAIKKKQDSSMFRGLQMLSEGYVDAFVSAGNTGAVLSTATVLLGRIKGVSRPTIGTFMPSKGSYPTFILDVGANTVCKPRYLYEFAVMGSINVSQSFGLERPKIALLNIGEEPSKGTDTILQAYEMLKDSNLNFIGNIEGGDVLQHAADVVVCDGFTGNIMMKFAESIVGFLKYKFKDYADKNPLNLVKMATFKPTIKTIFKDFDYQEYGGVPLLGVNGVVIIGHGKSSPLAVQNMIFKAVSNVKNDINGKIENALKQHNFSEQMR